MVADTADTAATAGMTIGIKLLMQAGREAGRLRAVAAAVVEIQSYLSLSSSSIIFWMGKSSKKSK